MHAFPKTDEKPISDISRLIALTHFDVSEQAAVLNCLGRPQHVSARQNIVSSGEILPAMLWVIDGWAYRWCVLSDGRRQIIQFLLPGDILGASPTGLAEVHGLTALTPVVYSAASRTLSKIDNDRLAQVVAVARAQEERSLHRQITRLGRMRAHERVADWLLEISARLKLAGQCDGDKMLIPVTQEILADALGLTGVHINRTLQSLRRSKLIEFERGRVAIINRQGCEVMVGNSQAAK